jgi:cytochrome c oxidase accessory protein FixG
MNNPVEFRPKAGAFGDRVEAVNNAQSRSLYVARQHIHPKAVHGTFRTLKWAFMAVLLIIYYGTPWLRYDRGPDIPGQAVLVDLAHSRLFFFFIEVWPEEFYLATGLLVLAALGLFLATALAGRLWCGYACPQTVWTDLFIKVEEWVEGDRAARIRLDKAPWSVNKLIRRTVKHIVWILIAAGTGGAWVFYFDDAPTLTRQLLTFDAPLVAYSTIAILTATTYVMAGFMREQVCTYMCPYSRFQGAMMDGDSYTTTYKLDRGEPRGAYRKGESFLGRGDCIDCTQCVAACPAGIDIRDGQQLECINCGLCIDACDDVMTKIGRPTGLIAWDTLNNLNLRLSGKADEHNPIRARTIIYTFLIMLVGTIMATAMTVRAPFKFSVQHDRDPLFVVLADGSIRNGFTVKIENRHYQDEDFQITLRDLPEADLKIAGENLAEDGGIVVRVPADQVRSYRAYVHLPRNAKPNSDSVPVTFNILDLDTQLDRDSKQALNIQSMFRSPK